MNIDDVYIALETYNTIRKIRIKNELIDIVRLFIYHRNHLNVQSDKKYKAAVYIDDITKTYVPAKFNDFSTYRIPHKSGFLTLYDFIEHGIHWVSIELFHKIIIFVEFFEYDERTDWREYVSARKLLN